jgi:presenilin-like A22 family membrane protease
VVILAVVAQWYMADLAADFMVVAASAVGEAVVSVAAVVVLAVVEHQAIGSAISRQRLLLQNL